MSRRTATVPEGAKTTAARSRLLGAVLWAGLIALCIAATAVAADLKPPLPSARAEMISVPLPQHRPKPSIAVATESPYQKAFQLARQADWATLRKFKRRPVNRPLEMVLRWMAMKNARSGAEFEQISRFLHRHPGWPNRATLIRRAELTMKADMPTAERKAWFEQFPPRTITGKLRHLETLKELETPEAYGAAVRQVWKIGCFNSRQERAFRRKFGRLLRSQDHWARLDRLLWDGHVRSARRMFVLADKPHRALAHARLSLRRRTGNVDAAIRRVPDRLKSDPGLQYERLRWRHRKSMMREARDLMWDIPPNNGHPKLWWRARSRQIRYALDQGDFEDAYLLSAAHAQKTGAEFADAQWHAGWVSLRFIGKATEALSSFSTLYDAVKTPISRSRAAYWAGRAAMAAGQPDTAQRHFRIAAQHQTTFYGQLGAGHISERPRHLPAAPDISKAERTAFNDELLTRAIAALAHIGERKMARSFLRHSARIAKTGARAALISQLARRIDLLESAVYAARRAAWRGQILIDEGYPTPPLPALAGLEQALVLAVIRQESGFRADAISRAGARGLMQLMPPTAKRTAKSISIPYSKSRLLLEPTYNVRLGQAYLAQMLNRFKGSYILAIASYNAGPARVASWIKARGDPRTPQIDPIDWIERIPFNETRNYVQRVLENLIIFRRRLGGRLPAGDPRDIWCGSPCQTKLDLPVSPS